jgi:ferredoxin
MSHEQRVHIVADRKRCEGHGICAALAPEVYDLDDDAMVVVRYDPVPPDLVGMAEAGATVCPVAALKTENHESA